MWKMVRSVSMVCSFCKGASGAPNHNVRTCPDLEVGFDKVAGAILSHAEESVAIGAITAICPPCGGVVISAVLAKKLYNVAREAYKGVTSKTQAEQRYHMKQAMLESVRAENFQSAHS